ncbi:putative membrane protein [Acinetobacter sp. 479375]|nr:putative membrane protein [Acinetobacter sp. 479375]
MGSFINLNFFYIIYQFWSELAFIYWLPYLLQMFCSGLLDRLK